LEQRQESLTICHRNLLQHHRIILQSFIVLEVVSHVFSLYPHTSQLAATLSDGVDSLIQGIALNALIEALSGYHTARQTYKQLIEPVELTPVQPYSPTEKELEAGTATPARHRAAVDEAQNDVDVAATSPAPPLTYTLPPDATHTAVFLLLRLTTLCFFWILTTRALSWNKSLCENVIAVFWYLHGAYSPGWAVCLILGVWKPFAPAWPVFTMKDMLSEKKKQKIEAYTEKA
jgi:hypothetical protein